MKRILAFLLVCLLVVFAGACNDGESADKSAAPTAEASASAGVDPDVSVDPTEDPAEDPTDDPSEEPSEEPSEDPGEETGNLADALRISLAYDADGNVYNAATAEGAPAITAKGNVSTAVDSATGKWVSNMPGGTSFYFVSIADLYDDLSNQFTVEYMFNLTEAPSSGYWSLGDNLEAGGFGAEIHPGQAADEATIVWNLHVDGAYYTDMKIPVKLNQWNHMVFTWDGSVTKGYLNGALMDEYDTNWGILGFPSDNTAHHIAIGACCAKNNAGGQSMKGSINGFSLYVQAMTDAEVTAAYNAFKA